MYLFLMFGGQDIKAKDIVMYQAIYASDPTKSRGRLFKRAEEIKVSRSDFQRDRDRIIHSGAFRKLQYKTQVFLYYEGDYFRSRLTHSLEVAQIARTIARLFQVNEDLAECIALAHDLGHTCFGHAGEDALDEVMRPYGGFDHNDQTFRIVTQLEKKYADFNGLNLTFEALEGIVKHNGPLLPLKEGTELPRTIADFQSLMNLELDGYASLEAQIAAISDDIAYNCHDIDDGIRSGILKLDALMTLPLVGPILKEVLTLHPQLEQPRLIHETIRRMMEYLVTDIYEEGTRRLAVIKPQSVEDIRAAGQVIITLSDQMGQDLRQVKSFLYKNLYTNSHMIDIRDKVHRQVQALFETFQERPSLMPKDWYDLRQGQNSELGKAGIVADYIAGMTDRFAMQQYEKILSKKEFEIA